MSGTAVNSKSSVKTLAINGLSIALVFLATGFINIRLPIAVLACSCCSAYNKDIRLLYSGSHNLWQLGRSCRQHPRQYRPDSYRSRYSGAFG